MTFKHRVTYALIALANAWAGISRADDLAKASQNPIGDNDMGTDKWSASAGVVALSMPGNWVAGLLAQNLWSFAGSDRARDVNKLTFQYFVNYSLSDGWYLTSTPVMTADWNEESGERWTVPIGGGVGRLVKFGRQPVDFELQAFSHVVKPDSGPH